MQLELQAFDAGSVPFLGRQYDRSAGIECMLFHIIFIIQRIMHCCAGTRDRMYVLIVVTPGNGHTLELQSPECTGYGSSNFVP